MKTLNEQLDRIKSMMGLINEQDSWVTRAANAEFSCGAHPRSELRQSKREAEACKNAAKKEWENLVNPKLDSYENKIDMDAFNTNFNKFKQQNPGFESEKTELRPEQAYAFLSKIAYKTQKNDMFWVLTKLNKKLNRTGPFTETDLYNVAKNMGGLQKFIDEYKNGFPETNH
jgi:hypothetical protein